MQKYIQQLYQEKVRMGAKKREFKIHANFTSH